MSSDVCANCDRPAKYRGKMLCARCYQRLITHGDFDRHDRVAQACQHLGCAEPVKAYGYCTKHWRRILQHGEPADRKWSHRFTDRCSVPRCGGEHRAMGLCEKHYTREQRNGHPLWRTLLREKVHQDRPWQEDTVVDPDRIHPR